MSVNTPGKRLTVGLSGGIGSGKSEVSRLFGQWGAEIIDADVMARLCVEPGTPVLQQLYKRYGEPILTSDEALNRPQLRQIIFHSAEEKAWVESIMHPEIRRLMVAAIEASQAPYNILVSPLLLETDQHTLVGRILIIDCDEQEQITRAAARDHSTPAEISAIMATQLSRDKRLARADDVVHNNGDLAELAPQVERLHRLYLTLAP